MASKSAAKYIMSDAGVPVVPGYHGEEQSVEYLAEQVCTIMVPIADLTFQVAYYFLSRLLRLAILCSSRQLWEAVGKGCELWVTELVWKRPFFLPSARPQHRLEMLEF